MLSHLQVQVNRVMWLERGCVTYPMWLLALGFLLQHSLQHCLPYLLRLSACLINPLRQRGGGGWGRKRTVEEVQQSHGG